MKLDSLEPAFREKVEKVIADLAAKGVPVCATSCRRTIAEQNTLYAKGRTAPGQIVTKARGGQSPHNFGLAVDFCPLKDGKLDWDAPLKSWDAIGEAARAHGLTWGGDFKSIVDRPHVEDPSWKTVQTAWKRGDIQVA